MKSGWEHWRSSTHDRSEHFKVELSSDEARRMSRRQIDDFYGGMALIAATFVPDERFDAESTQQERIDSVNFDIALEDSRGLL